MDKKMIACIAAGVVAVSAVVVWTVSSVRRGNEGERSAAFGYVNYDDGNGVQRVVQYTDKELREAPPLQAGAIFADDEKQVYKVEYYAKNSDGVTYLKAKNVDDGKTYVLGSSGMEPEGGACEPSVDNDQEIQNAIGAKYANREFTYTGDSGTAYVFGAESDDQTKLHLRATAKHDNPVGFDVSTGSFASAGMKSDEEVALLSEKGKAMIQGGGSFAFAYVSNRVGGKTDAMTFAVDGKADEYRVRVMTFDLKTLSALDVFELVIAPDKDGRLAVKSAASLDTIKGEAEAEKSRKTICKTATDGLTLARADLNLDGITAADCVTEILYANKTGVYAPVRMTSTIAYPSASTYPMIGVSFRKQVSGAPMLTAYLQPGHGGAFEYVGYSVSSEDNLQYAWQPLS